MSSARTFLLVPLTLLAWLAVSSPAAAVITNPFPGFDPDDGGELFNPSENVVNWEIADLGGFVDLETAEFGFFYSNAPETLIPIFESDDQRPPQQRASIDFVLGEVWDTDPLGGPPSLQNTFAVMAQSIGFYLHYADSGLGIDVTGFSVAALNDGGVDLFASFPHSTIPAAYLLGFEGPNRTVYFDQAFGIVRAPIPGTFCLLTLGLAAVGLSRSRNRRSNKG